VGPGFFGEQEAECFFKQVADSCRGYTKGVGFIAVPDVVRIAAEVMKAIIQMNDLPLIAENIGYEDLLHILCRFLNERPSIHQTIIGKANIQLIGYFDFFWVKEVKSNNRRNIIL
jgi:hypothetical protein